MSKIIHAADLFCGAGGTSTGLAKTCESIGIKLELLAINHWDVAIQTHSANHPDAKHLCETLDNVDPRKVVPSGRLNLLIASPECNHHSNARGGRPMNDQSRASAWHIVRWAEALYIDNILIENVREFLNWGPLGANGRLLKKMKGRTFLAFIESLRSLGYNVDWKVMNAANFGDPTTRERLFILARRGNRRIEWPTPTHSAKTNDGMFKETKPWRTAREIIDWSLQGQSIFNRKKPLASSTINRIKVGLRKFGGKNAEPFLLIFRKCMDARSEGGKKRVHSVDEPMPTIAGGGNQYGVVEPFIIPACHGSKDTSSYSIEEPLRTITAKEQFGLVEMDGVRLDIRFRMLQPHELARAMSFPDYYQFSGNREAKVKQIGNAVPVNLAAALCGQLLKENLSLSKHEAA